MQHARVFGAVLVLGLALNGALHLPIAQSKEVTPLPPDAGVTEPAQSLSTAPSRGEAGSAPASPQMSQEPQQNPVARPQPSQRVVAKVPTSLSIPSISLNDPIVPVGLTSDGAVDVPPGTTKNVGWYQNGTVPGEVGSALLDAHVFAAFSRLNKVNVGDDIYVEDADHTTRHFKVRDIELYALADVPADVLFNRDDTERLNLITCAGKLTKDHSTYTHRLVVYATLVH